MKHLFVSLIILLGLLAIAEGKTLKVDTLTPSVSDGDLTLLPDGTGDIVFGTFSGVLKSSSGVLSAGTVDLTSEITGILPIANGGTGSASQNFVDLTTGQSIAGDKTLSGTINVTGKLTTTSTANGAIPCPKMTEAQRDAIGVPVAGDCVFNTDTQKLNTYDGTATAWVVAGSGAGNLENILLNASFEESTAGNDAKDWTLTGATGTITESSTIDGGEKYLSLALSSTLSLSQEITATQYNPNVVSFSLWVKSSVTDLQLCGTLATVEQECVSYDGSNQWKKLQVLVTAPSSGAMGLKLKTLASTSGTVLVDAGEFSSNSLKIKDGIIINRVVGKGNGGSSVTAAVTDVTFTEVVDDINAWNGTQYTVPYDADVTITGQVATTGGGNIPAQIYKGGVLDAVVGYGAGNEASFSITKKYLRGDVLSVRLGVTRTLSNSSTYHHIEITAVAQSPQILTANDVVSSDTINWSFKSTAIVDSDPVGTYNLYEKASSSNSVTICATAPTTPPNNNDGLFIYAIPYTASSNCTTAPSFYVVKIGKGLKGHKLQGYASAGKTTAINTDIYRIDASEEGGVRSAYSEKDGTLTIESSINTNGVSSGRNIGIKYNPLSYISNGYLHFAASKNPVISALDAVPRVDFSWENEFSARIANNGTATITSQSSEFIESVNRASAGVVDVVFKSGFFTAIPSITGSAETNAQNFAIESLSTSGFRYKTWDVVSAESVADRNVSFSVSRQGSDARSRGDAAAIISQPTCYVREERTSALSSSSTTVHTRGLNATYGDCSFASLSSNQITLNKGSYKIRFRGLAYKSDYSHVFLYNVSDLSYFSTKAYGTYNSPTDAVESNASGEEYVTLTSSKTFELRQYIQTGAAGGLCNYGVGAGGSPLTSIICSEMSITRVK